MDLQRTVGRACIVVGGLAFLASTVAVVVRSLEPPGSTDDMVALGEERLARGDLGGARSWFAKAAAASPDGGAAAHAAEARVLELQGQVDEALQSYREAADAAPGELAPALALARALARAGRTREARETFEEAGRRHPGSADPLLELASLDLAGGDLDGAAAVYRRIEEAFPGEVRGPLGIAAVAETRGEARLAREAYERARRVDASSVPAAEGLGRVAAAAGDFEAAEAAYRRVVELAPEDGTALTVLASLVERRGRYEEAAGMFRRALEMLAGDEEERRESRALASTGLGTCLLALDRRDEAYEALAASLTDEPDQPEALWALVPIYLEREEFGAAARALRRVIPRRGEDPLLWVMLGRAEAGQGRWAEARQAFSYALELDEDHRDARLWLGIALRVLGEYRAAAATLEGALREGPPDYLGSLNLAIALGQLGERREAARRFAEARAIDPERPEAFAQEAHLLLATERAAPALVLAQRAVTLAPDDPAALEVLARALSAAGRDAEAAARARAARAHARDDAQRQYLDELVERLSGSDPDKS